MKRSLHLNVPYVPFFFLFFWGVIDFSKSDVRQSMEKKDLKNKKKNRKEKIVERFLLKLSSLYEYSFATNRTRTTTKKKKKKKEEEEEIQTNSRANDEIRIRERRWIFKI